MENEIKKYFRKLEQKKVTKKIINELRYQRRILTSMFIIGGILCIWIFKTSIANDDIQGTAYISVWLMVYILFFVGLLYIFLDNKEFYNLSIQDQQFYLLYLIKEYIYVFKTDKKYKDSKASLTSICRYYIRTLNRQRNLIRSYSPFKITEEEILLRQIRDCFGDKIIGLINNQENIDEIKRIIDILFYINVQGTVLLNSKSVVDEVNNEIKNKIKEYLKLDDTLPVMKDKDNKFKKSIEVVNRIRESLNKHKSIVVILLTVIITAVYILVEWKLSSSINALGVFTILLTAPASITVITNINDKKKEKGKD
ncbi:MAG: hypothetical protein E6370_16870 [Clostridiales bacterium]|nr:hypothetical protein [Clostridiales bacterium]